MTPLIGGGTATVVHEPPRPFRHRTDAAVHKGPT